MVYKNILFLFDYVVFTFTKIQYEIMEWNSTLPKKYLLFTKQHILAVFSIINTLVI